MNKNNRRREGENNVSTIGHVYDTKKKNKSQNIFIIQMKRN